MDTILKTPEQVMCSQDEELVSEEVRKEFPNKDNHHLYFIAKGKCLVTVKDKFKDRYEEYQARILAQGDHFGEIGMIYKCKRSATVIATNYCTCA